MAPWWNPFDRTPDRADAQKLLPDGGAVPADHLRGQARADEWSNILTGLGTSDDKRTATVFSANVVSNTEARDLWRGDDIAAKGIETLPKEMFRRGFRISIAGDDDKKIGTALLKRMEQRAANKRLARAKMFSRAYGGGAIHPVLNDGSSNLAAPLSTDRISTVRFYQVYEPRELSPVDWYRDGSEEQVGRPSVYEVRPVVHSGLTSVGYGTRIHASRLVIFRGIQVSNETPDGVEYGWDDNHFTRVRSVLRDFHLSFGSLVALLQDFSQGVFKMAGLKEQMAKDRGDVVKRRLMMMDLIRSVLKMMPIDKDDDFVRQSTPISGGPEMLVHMMARVAAAWDMPQTKLFGSAPAGMNATGESDTRTWYETVAAEQSEDTDTVEELVRFEMLALDGPCKGVEPEEWSVQWHPLWAPSAKEEADTAYTVAQTDAINVELGLYNADEAARSHYSGDTFHTGVTIDWKERDKQLKANEEAAAAAAASLGGGSSDVQAEALNGAQVASLVTVSKEVAAGTMAWSAGVAIVQAMLPTKSPAECENIVGPKDFKAAEPAPKASPFGGGATGAKTAPKEEDPKAPTTEPVPAEDPPAED